MFAESDGDAALLLSLNSLNEMHVNWCCRFLGPFLEGPGKPLHYLKPYDYYGAVLLTYP